MASSSRRQPNFAALNRGRHLCSAGRPSRWELAHILKSNVVSNKYVLFNYLDIRILAQTCNTANSLGRRRRSSSSSVRQHTVAGCSSFQTRRPPLAGGCRQSVERSTVDDRGFNVTRCLRSVRTRHLSLSIYGFCQLTNIHLRMYTPATL